MDDPGTISTTATPSRPEAEVVDAADRERDLLHAALRLCLEMLPDSFPPPSTVYRWFAGSAIAAPGKRSIIVCSCGTASALAARLARRLQSWTARVSKQRKRAARAATMRGKKVLGRKRHAMVDTDGRALKLHAHPASVQDRDGAGPLLKPSRPRFPFIERVFADSGYAGPRVAKATRVAVEIVRKQPGQVGFAVQASKVGCYRLYDVAKMQYEWSATIDRSVLRLSSRGDRGPDRLRPPEAGNRRTVADGGGDEAARERRQLGSPRVVRDDQGGKAMPDRRVCAPPTNSSEEPTKKRSRKQGVVHCCRTKTAR